MLTIVPDSLKAAVPGPLKNAVRPLLNLLVDKHGAELSYWRKRFAEDGGRFANAHYERLMLRMACESNPAFLDGKVVADFGCGPRGSLVWAKAARLRIGIDVLADRYADEFGDDTVLHGMVYLKCTETRIPLPSGFVDVLFTMNALDHVDKLDEMCDELMRVIRPGGTLVGSFNLGEPATPYEPQCLSEQTITNRLLSKLDVESYLVTEQGPKEDRYAPFFGDQPLAYTPGREGLLWVKATKPDRTIHAAMAA